MLLLLDLQPDTVQSKESCNSQFSFLWQYLKMCKQDFKLNSQRFVDQHGVDVSEELVQE